MIVRAERPLTKYRLKTRDIQTIFSTWEHEKGGFRIKWLDDINALIVFNDATVGKCPLFPRYNNGLTLEPNEHT